MTDLLYARVDVIGGVADDDPRLLELELVEPSLGWRQLETEERDLAQRKFVIGVEDALERLGLGPLGQRGRG
ncbi:glutathione synthase/ribosomal protein S6 modification enzyme [Mycobacteroides abscessus subsp. abscessus]|nr:glutathione synthase/ribosomal protein S6 modification enzyme [Mycobacteroides abscessus subsp. abscessus]